jgi:hypothetical protein
MKNNTEIKSGLDYMNEKGSDFSQKIWLLTFEGISLVGKNGGNKWLLFFCLVTDHVNFPGWEKWWK